MGASWSAVVRLDAGSAADNVPVVLQVLVRDSCLELCLDAALFAVTEAARLMGADWGLDAGSENGAAVPYS